MTCGSQNALREPHGAQPGNLNLSHAAPVHENTTKTTGSHHGEDAPKRHTQGPAVPQSPSKVNPGRCNGDPGDAKEHAQAATCAAKSFTEASRPRFSKVLLAAFVCESCILPTSPYVSTHELHRTSFGVSWAKFPKHSCRAVQPVPPAKSAARQLRMAAASPGTIACSKHRHAIDLRKWKATEDRGRPVRHRRADRRGHGQNSRGPCDRWHRSDRAFTDGRRPRTPQLHGTCLACQR